MKRVICFEEIMSCSLAERCLRFLQFDSFDAVHSDAKARVGAFPVKYDIIQHPGNVINDCADFSFPQIQPTKIQMNNPPTGRKMLEEV